KTVLGSKTQIQHLGSRFRSGSLQSTCRIFRDRTCVTCHQIELCQTQGLRAAVPIVCTTGAGRRQPDRSQSDVVLSRVWITDVSADMEISTRITRYGHAPFLSRL